MMSGCGNVLEKLILLEFILLTNAIIKQDIFHAVEEMLGQITFTKSNDALEQCAIRFVKISTYFLQEVVLDSLNHS